MSANESSPTPAPSKRAPESPPGAPLKSKVGAWGEFVDGLETMPARDARKLKAKDVGVHLGPIMDEAQFKAYREARAAARATASRK